MSGALSIVLITLVVFEPLMSVVHRRLFHGPLWRWHRSHHESPNAHRLVLNDLIWVIHFALSGILILLGAAGIGSGAALYGLAYVLAHDGLAHGRFPVPSVLRRTRLFRRLIRAHHLHHRTSSGSLGAVPFGIYSALVELRLADRES